MFKYTFIDTKLKYDGLQDEEFKIYLERKTREFDHVDSSTIPIKIFVKT